MGGCEGIIADRQPVLIPDQGVLSYYWRMHSHEPTIIDDFFDLDLYNPDGT